MTRPLVSLREILAPAEADGYAVGAFIMCNAETADAIMAAAQQEKSPVIVMLGPKEEPVLGLQNTVQIVSTLARNYDIPVCLHLDHSRDPAQVQAALEAGFPSVMIDASSRPDEENAQITRRIVELARKTGATVEGEIGFVGFPEMTTEADNANSNPAESRLTQPAAAEHFVRVTGIDALAVSIGTAHGRNPGLHELDFQRLAEIECRVEVPLVLHGATGRAPDQIRRAIQLGIRKVNVATDLARVFADTMAEALQKGQGFFWHADAIVQVKQRWVALTRRWIEVLGSKCQIVDRGG